jgi:flagella basal body P-ring formation protein FlgA
MRFARAVLVLAGVIASAAAQADEQFVAPTGVRGTLEIRGEATVVGGDVKLRQVCRWNETDEAAFGAVGDLVIAKLPAGGSQAIELNELKATLRDAGVGLAAVRFAGPIRCTVTRSDAAVPEPATTAPAVTPVTTAATTAAVPATQHVDASVISLKERLTRDLAERLALPVDSVQIVFNPQDEKLLNLAEPQFRFMIEPRRARNLGPVSWEVAIETEGARGIKPQRTVIGGIARAWQDQVVANKPISGRQTIREDDVVERRALVDRVEDAPLLKRAQAVGQQAVLDLKPGTVLTARAVEAVPLARTGQLITVTTGTNGIQVRTVARAMDGGTYGQSIRVRNEATKDVYEVILTGPQAGSMTGSNG